MPSIKYFIKLIFAYIKRFRELIIASSLLGVLLFFLIRFATPFFFDKSVERIGITGRFHTDQLPPEILGLISNGLTSLSENYTVEPDLAGSWETPDKGKTWTFRLKEDVSWQDGEKVTSDSIVYEFSDVEIQTPDERTITFSLKEPFVPFPTVLARPTFRQGLLGTGEWEVEKITVVSNFVQELVLVNDEKDKIIYKFYPTSERTKLAYKLGEVDKLQETLDPTPFNEWQNTQLTQVINENQVVTIFFNTKDQYLSEKNLRQALAYAINKESLGKRALGPIPPNSWVYNPQVKEYTYDVPRVRELLEELPEEVLENLEIKLVSTPALLQTAEAISSDWEAVGVRSVVQVSSIVPSEFQVYLTIFDTPKDPDQYPIWHSTQTGTNISKYQSPRIDTLLESGRTELNPEERRRIYLDFQRFLLEDLPAAFLYHPAYYTVSRK